MSLSSVHSTFSPATWPERLRRASTLREVFARADEPELDRESLQDIEALEPGLNAESDGALRRRAANLRRRAEEGTPLDDLLVEAFALARQGAHRVLGHRPYDEQMLGGIELHRGRVAEMQTGEGKTLAAVAPVSLAALTGGGAHVLTFNDYLARRDAAWMGPVYRFLGISVGCVQEGMSVAERRAAYARDVTYLTAKEAGFDLLRDGLCLDPAHQVHRPLRFALVDEADSILIDEARIPLVIAGATQGDDLPLPRLAQLARRLDPATDFDTDEYRHNIFLTERGATMVEAALDCDSLVAAESVALLAAVRNALHAEYLLRRDVDYIVRNGEVELVDELTGRVAENRHWPDGLQGAVEAKEGLRLGADGRILGAITLQHLLQLYDRLCGMTATAVSAADELRQLYDLEVVAIPPHRPDIRDDLPERIYARRAARDRAVVEEIVRVHGSGRPILVGTASVAASERLAAALREEGVACQVLNAKNDELEATVVAEAGDLDAVTISTNMAGRGTDVRLGGQEESHRAEVLALGGLYVIGTNRHESVRIDRQLRGRAARQGDPGSTRFFVSLEDDLLQRYGIERLIPRRYFPPDAMEPVDSPLVRREVDRAQRIVEGECADVRKRLYQYSEILEQQRRHVADWRQSILIGEQGLDLLAQRGGERYERFRDELGEEHLGKVERRLTLLVLDRCWSEYLTEMQQVRDEVHLVTLDGREPLAEFYRTAIRAFEQLEANVDEEILSTFARLDIGPEGVDWHAAGLRGPAATWTYLVSDSVFGNNVLGTLANRASIGFLGSIALGPLLFVWGLYLHWQRRRSSQRRERID